MNLRKLPKEKRTHLILAILVTLVAVGAVGYLIHYQQGRVEALRQKRLAVEAKLRQVQDAVKHTQQIETDLSELGKTLGDLEGDIATGDWYSWVVNTLRRFKAAYKVDLPQVSPISAPSDVNLLAGFPYKQVTFTVTGAAHFHDFGRFLADFENQFPHMRVLDLNVELNGSTAAPDEQESISFKMQIATLVKSTTS
ncbi:conserved exported hypothetical protein [Verrucomicrobia bacterium]|nr:conserved exported hypothetical protein [Verrucomicrobiota bacterium]